MMMAAKRLNGADARAARRDLTTLFGLVSSIVASVGNWDGSPASRLGHGSGKILRHRVPLTLSTAQTLDDNRLLPA
jgi:hypothetical protein